MTNYVNCIKMFTILECIAIVVPIFKFCSMNLGLWEYIAKGDLKNEI